MKREEKNQLSRQKILESAIREFGEHGYGMGSINSICSDGDISKGALYHHFKDKDQVYLMCVGECFDALVSHLRRHLEQEGEDAKGRLERYFDARMEFFRENPLYQRIFCEVVISPPGHLADEIRKTKEAFDELNVEILGRFLEQALLRPDVTKEEVIETFGQYQDFVNAGYRASDMGRETREEHEQRCRRALDILLYGVIKR